MARQALTLLTTYSARYQVLGHLLTRGTEGYMVLRRLLLVAARPLYVVLATGGGTPGESGAGNSTISKMGFTHRAQDGRR